MLLKAAASYIGVVGRNRLNDKHKNTKIQKLTEKNYELASVIKGQREKEIAEKYWDERIDN